MFYNNYILYNELTAPIAPSYEESPLVSRYRNTRSSHPGGPFAVMESVNYSVIRPCRELAADAAANLSAATNLSSLS